MQKSEQPKFRQEVINLVISKILNEMSFKAVGEVIYNKKLPDIIIEIDGIKINLEGWFEKTISIDKLKEKCKERVEEGICHIAIGLLYPKDLNNAENYEILEIKIKKSNYKVFIFSPSSKGTKDQYLGQITLKQLAESLNHLYGEVVKEDLLKRSIDKIENTIQECANIALSDDIFFSSDTLIENLKKVLGIEEELKKEIKIFKEDLIKVALFVIFDGLLFHQVLSTHHKNIKGLEINSIVNIRDFIQQQWIEIMKINYLPIFELAYKIVTCLPNSLKTNQIFQKLIEVVSEVVSSGVLLKHDLMGRVYHKLLLKTTGKFYASYYTSIPAATLLSNLAIKTENPDVIWNFENLENLQKLKVLDPACGSGTLLSGMYRAIKDKYILESYKNKNASKLNFTNFHKLMIEQVLHGWDILDYACHLTLTTLALHNPKALFKQSNIYILPSGQFKDDNGIKIYLGSLSLLEPNQNILPIKDLMLPVKRKEINREIKEYIEPTFKNFDIIIMNPPYSRSCKPNIKFGYRETDTKVLMNKKLKEISKKLGYQRIGHAGLGAYFIILADKLLKERGRLAFVIPRSFLSSVAWQEIRNLLIEKYEIEYIVSNFDPGSKNAEVEPWNWSENTDLGEVLVVARKTNKEFDARYTTFINLWSKPKNELEALKIASDSIKFRNESNLKFLEKNEDRYAELIIDKPVGIVYNVSQKYLKKNFLIPCLFANPILNKFVFELNYFSPLNLIPLINIVKVKDNLGVDIAQIKATFTHSQINTPYKILWGHNASMNTIELKSSHIGYGNLKKNENSKIYDKKANFLIAERPHLNTESLVAMYSPDKLLATAFWEVNVDPDIGKILTLWLNSTFGFLLLLSNSVNSMGQIFKIKKEQLMNLLVIDLNSLTDDHKKQLLDLYDKLKNMEFQPFPKEFELASQGKGVRIQIDQVFIEIIKSFNSKFDIELQSYYEILSKEPILTLKNLILT